METSPRAVLCLESGGATSLWKGWRRRAGSWAALGLEQEQWEFGITSFRPQIPRFADSWELGWAATAIRGGHGTGKRARGGCGAATSPGSA